MPTLDADTRESLAGKASQFRRMHQGPSILVLPNAWDAATARVKSPRVAWDVRKGSVGGVGSSCNSRKIASSAPMAMRTHSRGLGRRA